MGESPAICAAPELLDSKRALAYQMPLADVDQHRCDYVGVKRPGISLAISHDSIVGCELYGTDGTFRKGFDLFLIVKPESITWNGLYPATRPW